MAEFRKISEELDFLQKKVASLREIYKLYPDTLIKGECYHSKSVTKDTDIIRFSYDSGFESGRFVWAFVSKVFGCVEVFGTPMKFSVLMYDPYSTHIHLLVQEYRENMKRHDISEDLIRQADLYVLKFISDRHINIKDTNLDNLRNDDLKKLLVLQ